MTSWAVSALASGRTGKNFSVLALDGNLMAASVKTEPRIEAGSPVPLFAVSPVAYGSRNDYAAARDGQRFLVNGRTGPPLSYLINMVTDWLHTQGSCTSVHPC